MMIIISQHSQENFSRPSQLKHKAPLNLQLKHKQFPVPNTKG